MAYAALLFIPLSLALRYLVDAPPTWVFLTGAAAIGVLADWIRRATEQLAERAGSAIGGLLNVSFGNTAELVPADGETTWFEGLLLVGVYVWLALACYLESPM